jgi:hypothetical protein
MFRLLMTAADPAADTPITELVVQSYNVGHAIARRLVAKVHAGDADYDAIVLQEIDTRNHIVDHVAWYRELDLG